MTLFKNKNVMMGIGAVVLIALGYYFFGPSAPAADLSVGAAANPAELLFINLAGQLDSIAFKDGFLIDPRFRALVDIRTAILPESSGRPDPFAPIK